MILVGGGSDSISVRPASESIKISNVLAQPTLSRISKMSCNGNHSGVVGMGVGFGMGWGWGFAGLAGDVGRGLGAGARGRWPGAVLPVGTMHILTFGTMNSMLELGRGRAGRI